MTSMVASCTKSGGRLCYAGDRADGGRSSIEAHLLMRTQVAGEVLSGMGRNATGELASTMLKDLAFMLIELSGE
jgi:hypothetical protein